VSAKWEVEIYLQATVQRELGKGEEEMGESGQKRSFRGADAA